jgi:hypothetical protein
MRKTNIQFLENNKNELKTSMYKKQKKKLQDSVYFFISFKHSEYNFAGIKGSKI